MKNVKGAATTRVRMLPLQRFHRAIHPPVHPFHSSPSHTPGYIASIFSRSSRAASSAALVPTLLFIFSLPVAPRDLRRLSSSPITRFENFSYAYIPRYFFTKRTVRINGAVSAITRRVQILKKFSLGISRYRKIAGVENMKHLYRSFQPRKIQSCLNCTFNEGTKNIEFRP